MYSYTQYPDDGRDGERDRPSTSLSAGDITPLRSSTPLQSFMSEMLHTEQFADLKLVPDGSPAHRSKRCSNVSHRRGIDHSYRRRLKADMSLDLECHFCSRNCPPLVWHSRHHPSSVGSRSPESRNAFCLDNDESPTFQALSRGLEICNDDDMNDEYEEEISKTDEYCDQSPSAHVIERWRNGVDSPNAKKHIHFKPALRLPSFDHTPLPATSSSSSPPPSPQPPPRPWMVHRRGGRRPGVAFPKEKWRQEIPALNIVGIEDGSLL